MKPEPLKDKWIKGKGYGSKEITIFTVEEATKDIKSAVEWLRMSIGKEGLITIGSVKSKIDKAFEDIMKSSHNQK